VLHCYVVPFDAAQQHMPACSFLPKCCVASRGTGQASLASVRELLRGERFALSAAEVERLVQQLGVANDSDVVRYDEWAAAMISWKTVRVARYYLGCEYVAAATEVVCATRCLSCGPDLALPALTAPQQCPSARTCSSPTLAPPAG